MHAPLQGPLYADRLLPNVVILRLPPLVGLRLRQTALRVGTEGIKTAAASLAQRTPFQSLISASESGVFGTADLSTLSTYLQLETNPNGPTVKELVQEAEWEGLSEEGRLEKERAAAASQIRRDAARESQWLAAEEAEYQRLLGGQGRTITSDSLRAFAPQAALGGGLLIALLSATLLGYFLGHNIFGPNSTGAWTLALVFGIGTLVLEGTLLVLRLSRNDSYERKGRQGKSENPVQLSQPPSTGNDSSASKTFLPIDYGGIRKRK